MIAQVTRRVLCGKSVPAMDKVVSLFELHTDVIVKDRRETYYGHKVFLTGSASGLILDCAIAKGNPADSTWTVPMLKRQRSLYGRPPRQASFDGSFASKDNLYLGKSAQGERRLLRQAAQAGRARHGEKQLGVSKAPRISRRDRERYLAPQARLRAGLLHLERCDWLRRLRANGSAHRQPPNSRATPIGLNLYQPNNNFITRSSRAAEIFFSPA